MFNDPLQTYVGQLNGNLETISKQLCKNFEVVQKFPFNSSEADSNIAIKVKMTKAIENGNDHTLSFQLHWYWILFSQF